MSDTIVAPTHSIDTTDEPDDDRQRHYAFADDIMEAYVEGTPLTALCGKTWVPSRDPDKYPTCELCAERKLEMERSEGKA